MVRWLVADWDNGAVVEERRDADPADSVSPIERAQAAMARHAWREAFDLLSAADAELELPLPGLELLAQSAWWTGQLPLAMEIRERAYSTASRSGDTAAAAASAIALAQDNVLRNDMAVARAWIAHADRLLEGEPEALVHGYLGVVKAFAFAITGDPAASLEQASLALDVGTRMQNRDLAMIAASAKGFALVTLGRVEEGLVLIDEATIAAVSGELEAGTAGGVGCTTIEACAALGDWARAATWT
jgi:hypothetical protein